MARRLLKSKKGAIPIINETIMVLVNIIPTPIKILLFVGLLSLFATIVMPMLFNLFGYECLQVGSEMKLYKVPIENILPNTYDNIKQQVRQWAGFKDYELPQDPFPNGDKRFLRIPNECFVQVYNGSTPMEGYTGACTDCPYLSYFVRVGDITIPNGIVRTPKSICIGDGNFKAQANPDLVWKNFCSICSPPSPYYFNYTNCVNNSVIPTDQCYFTITNESLAGQIISEDFQANYYYQQIIKLGGIEQAQDDTQFTNIKCDAKKRPNLYMFNIEIFNYQMWVFLFISQALITFAFSYYAMVLK